MDHLHDITDLRTQHRSTRLAFPALLLLCAGASGCGGDDPPEEQGAQDWTCELEADESPDYLQKLGCQADFEALASLPLDASISGARSVKVVLDSLPEEELFFQNSKKYQIHYDFASEHLSGIEGRPPVGTLANFNSTEYLAPDRRFTLGAVTYYEQPDKWVLELAPLDTASAERIENLYELVKAAGFFGPVLHFHPTSQSLEATAADLSEAVSVVSNKDIYEGITYQPLNLAESCGRLRFIQDLTQEQPLFDDIVVLERVPNDITVVSGLITQEFQTPLSHVNVLSQNRGTPNMGLKNAMSDPELLALEGEWVRLDVDAFEFTIEQISAEEAQSCIEEQKPEPLGRPDVDKQTTELRNILDLVVEQEDTPLKDDISACIPTFGGKACHYSILATVEEARAPAAFAIPVYYYFQFLEENGFDSRIAEMLEDDDFNADPELRDQMLSQLRDDMEHAPVNADFEQSLVTKLEEEFPDTRMRFRSSTNAEDLEGFSGAGLFTSRSGDPEDPAYPVLDAIRTVWSSVWYFRAFEERRYWGMEHEDVGMALLVHHSFPDEEANGVAFTANPFDPAGLNPGFYVNVQVGDASVVMPPPGVTTDQFIHYFYSPDEPVAYISSSNLVAEGEHVLTRRQIHDLGVALDAIHNRFSAAYGPASGNNGWYAMDTEFKFDGLPGETPELAFKQARPAPSRGQ